MKKKLLSLILTLAMIASLITAMPASAAVVAVGEKLSEVTSEAELNEMFTLSDGAYNGTDGKLIIKDEASGEWGYIELFGKKEMPDEYVLTTKHSTAHNVNIYLNYKNENSHYVIGGNYASGGLTYFNAVTSEGTVTLADATALADIASSKQFTITKTAKDDGSTDFVIYAADLKKSVTVNDANKVKPTGGVAYFYLRAYGEGYAQIFDWEYTENVVRGQDAVEFSSTGSTTAEISQDTVNFTLSSDNRKLKYNTALAGNYEIKWGRVACVNGQEPYVRFNEDSFGNYYELYLNSDSDSNFIKFYKYDNKTQTKSEQILDTDVVGYYDNYITVKQTEENGKITLDITLASKNDGTNSKLYQVIEEAPVSTGGYTSIYMPYQNVSTNGFSMKHNDAVNPPASKTYTINAEATETNGWNCNVTEGGLGWRGENIYKNQAFGTDYTLKAQVRKTYLQNDFNREMKFIFNSSSQNGDGQRYVLKSKKADNDNIKLSVLKYSYDENGALQETELASKTVNQTELIAAIAVETTSWPHAYLMDLTIDFKESEQGTADIDIDITYSMEDSANQKGTQTVSIAAQDSEPILAGYFGYGCSEAGAEEGNESTRGFTLNSLSVEQAIGYGEDYAVITPELNVSGIESEIPTNATVTFSAPSGAWSGMAYTDIALYENGATEKSAVTVSDVAYDAQTNNVAFKLKGLKNDVTYTMDIDTFDKYGVALTKDVTFKTFYSDSAYIKDLTYAADGNDLTYTFTIGNICDTEADVWVVVAAYDKEGKMISCSAETYTATSEEVQKSGTVMGAKDAVNVKAFALTGWATLKPYHKAVAGTLQIN